jgi:starvation-inducible DNA-binding protein
MPSSAKPSNIKDALQARPKTSVPDTGLDNAYVRKMAGTLTGILAATYRLTIKSHIYHWNVSGPLFKPIHELTEGHYNELFAAADVIAERIRALGHLAPVKIGDAADFAPEGASQEAGSAEAMVEDLAADHESLTRALRNAAGEAEGGSDAVTADMLTGRMAFHEKAIWMLRATISA